MVPIRGTAEGGTDHCGGNEHKVAFEAADGAINEQIDEAYRAEIQRQPVSKPMIVAGARAATIKITPREGNA